MAQSKQESATKPSSEEATGDALGAQVDALLDEMDQAVQGIEQETQAPAANADSKGFEQEAFSDKPPSASRVANAEPVAKDSRPAQASGGPSVEQVQAELDAAIDSALSQPAPAPSEEPAARKSHHPAPADDAGKAGRAERAPTEIQNLDERLADTASDDLGDNIDALLTSTPAPAPQPAAEASAPPAPVAGAPAKPPAESPSTPEIEASAPSTSAGAAPSPPEPEKPAAAAPPASDPPAPAKPVAPAPTAPAPNGSGAGSPSDTRVEVLVGGDAPAPERAPLLVRVCVGALRIINAPLAIVPPTARDIVGYLSLVTLFNAAGLWILILLRH